MSVRFRCSFCLAARPQCLRTRRRELVMHFTSTKSFIGVVVLCSLLLAVAVTDTSGQATVGSAPAQTLSLIGYMIVPDALEKSVEFYSHLLGLQMPNGDPRARLKWYDVVPFLT